jgi:hypothetical protein
VFDEQLLPQEHPTKGWNRVSITFWSRKPYRPRLTAADREIPKGRGPRMLAQCAVTGSLLSLSLVWFVLLVVSLYTSLSGAVYGGTLAGAAVVLTLVLYVISARRGREFS